jgi:preprotein translocase subunit SecG
MRSSGVRRVLTSAGAWGFLVCTFLVALLSSSRSKKEKTKEKSKEKSASKEKRRQREEPAQGRAKDSCNKSTQ